MSPAANTNSSISTGSLLCILRNPGPPLRHRAVPRPIAEKEAGGNDTAAPTTGAALARGGRPLVLFLAWRALMRASSLLARQRCSLDTPPATLPSGSKRAPPAARHF